MTPRRHDTRRRLLEAATTLFSERGFHRTTMREVAARAGVNLASGNYHFGSKRELYLEVLRTQFARVRGVLVRRGAQAPAEKIARMSRGECERLLEARIQVLLEVLLGPPPSVHGALFVREMADPSEALPVIVGELVAPMKRDMERIVARVEPSLTPSQVERCVFSIVGQVFHYRFALPVVLELLGLRRCSRRWVRETARHVAEFSLGGMRRLAGRDPLR